MQIPDSQKKVYAPRLAMMLWVFFFPLCFVLLTSGPPAKVPAYIFFALLAGVPVILGSRGYRVFGIVALAVSIWAAVDESRAGVRYQERGQQLRQKGLEKKSLPDVSLTNKSSLAHE
ncbi:MAG: hypothetical protein EPO07_08750 [Verrucomicrobia bacterium]|nr:MAG: hypothetical protein EPO07_08750 [Verrucomicrobiota bacterium]